jgi:hypothetical protein
VLKLEDGWVYDTWPKEETLKSACGIQVEIEMQYKKQSGNIVGINEADIDDEEIGHGLRVTNKDPYGLAYPGLGHFSVTQPVARMVYPFKIYEENYAEELDKKDAEEEGKGEFARFTHKKYKLLDKERKIPSGRFEDFKEFFNEKVTPGFPITSEMFVQGKGYRILDLFMYQVHKEGKFKRDSPHLKPLWFLVYSFYLFKVLYANTRAVKNEF